MKIRYPLFILMTAVSLSQVSALASPGSVGCKAASWNPELYTFYGAKTNIIENIAQIPIKLSERRLFVQITEGESKSEIRLYERQDDDTFSVTEWTIDGTIDLLPQIDKAIVANKGINCVGEQVKGLLKKRLKEGKTSKSIPPPESTKAAFTHSVKGIPGEFVKTTIIILC